LFVRRPRIVHVDDPSAREANGVEPGRQRQRDEPSERVHRWCPRDPAPLSSLRNHSGFPGRNPSGRCSRKVSTTGSGVDCGRSGAVDCGGSSSFGPPRPESLPDVRPDQRRIHIVHSGACDDREEARGFDERGGQQILPRGPFTVRNGVSPSGTRQSTSPGSSWRRCRPLIITRLLPICPVDRHPVSDGSLTGSSRCRKHEATSGTPATFHFGALLRRDDPVKNRVPK
jgi:hypothetical protein